MKKLILLSIILVAGCEENNIIEYTQNQEKTIIDIDWVLIKQPNMLVTGEQGKTMIDTGYIFVYIDRSMLTDSLSLIDIMQSPLPISSIDHNFEPPCVADWSSDSLIIKYNGLTYESFSYDISDSIKKWEYPAFATSLCNSEPNIQFNMFRIINAYTIQIDSLNYRVYLYNIDGEGLIITLEEPNILVDYRESN